MAADGQLINSRFTIILDNPPSCIEICPFYSSFAHGVIGTYSLESDDHNDRPQDDQYDQAPENKAQTRSGSLMLFRLEDTEISIIQTIYTPYAVLDLHFAPFEPDLLAIAASIGIISLFKVTDSVSLSHIANVELAEPSILVLSLAWCPREADASKLAASLSDGQIVTLDSQSPKISIRKAPSHSLEAWTVAWSGVDKREPSSQLYSGGDDSAICRQNLKDCQLNLAGSKEDNDLNAYSPLNRDGKVHGAGVTAILQLDGQDAGTEGKPQWLLTGSYDEHVRVLRLETSATGSRFQVLAEKRLHGGVWRLKLIATVANNGNPIFVVLASCMHAGARVLKVLQSQEGWSIEIVARFEEHESMNYASDARMDISANALDFTVVSTSFYDRKLCIWKYEEA